MSASHDREHVTCVDKSIPTNPSAVTPATDRKNLLKEMPHIVRPSAAPFPLVIDYFTGGVSPYPSPRDVKRITTNNMGSNLSRDAVNIRGVNPSRIEDFGIQPIRMC